MPASPTDLTHDPGALERHLSLRSGYVEDKPHPVGALLARSDFIKRPFPCIGLSQDKAIEVERVGHQGPLSNDAADVVREQPFQLTHVVGTANHFLVS